MAQTAKHAQKGGNSGAYNNLVKKGVPAEKAKSIAKTFRKNANKKAD